MRDRTGTGVADQLQRVRGRVAASELARDSQPSVQMRDSGRLPSEGIDLCARAGSIRQLGAAEADVAGKIKMGSRLR